MLKNLIFACLVLFFISCQQDDASLIEPIKSNLATQSQIDDAFGKIDPSVLTSDWWKAQSPTTQKLVGLELKRDGEPILMKELEAKILRAQKLSNARGDACPSFPAGSLNGDVILNSQDDVDAFGALKCKEIIGALVIEDTLGPSSICDLTPLRGLKEIGSSLTVNSDCLTNLEGLDKLKSIGELGPFGFVGIIGANLVDLEALSKVSTVTGSINIIDCDQLTSVTTAFSEITTIESGKSSVPLTSVFVLNINGNDILTDISAFANLTDVEGGLRILSNGALTDLDDLAALNNVGDDIFIIGNTALQNVNQLSVLSSLADDLFVFDNPSLSQCCGLYNLLCSDPPLCTTSGVADFVTIFNNGAGCTEADIIAGGPCP